MDTLPILYNHLQNRKDLNKLIQCHLGQAMIHTEAIFSLRRHKGRNFVNDGQSDNEEGVAALWEGHYFWVEPQNINSLW